MGRQARTAATRVEQQGPDVNRREPGRRRDSWVRKLFNFVRLRDAYFSRERSILGALDLHDICILKGDGC